MDGATRRRLLVVGLPPLALAALGLVHPMHLTDRTAPAWQALHVVLLPVFPLLALAPWLIARREHRVAGWVAAALGYTYAAFYTALDVLAGIGAGALQRAGAHAQTSVVFAQGNALSTWGVWAYLLAAVLGCAVALRRARWSAVPGALLVVGAAWSFLSSHVYWPAGVLTMLALAVGWCWLLVVVDRADGADARGRSARGQALPARAR